MVLLDTDLVIRLDLVTIFLGLASLTIVSLIADSLTTTETTISFTITTVSSSVLISSRLDFRIGGTPTTITDILTITPLTITRPYTITGIGTVWPLRCRRSLPDRAIITG